MKALQYLNQIKKVTCLLEGSQLLIQKRIAFFYGASSRYYFQDESYIRVDNDMTYIAYDSDGLILGSHTTIKTY